MAVRWFALLLVWIVRKSDVQVVAPACVKLQIFIVCQCVCVCMYVCVYITQSFNEIIPLLNLNLIYNFLYGANLIVVCCLLKHCVSETSPDKFLCTF